MRHFVTLLGIYFIILLFDSNLVFADKYSMRDRFGIGGTIGYSTSDQNPMNLGWYFNWSYSEPNSFYDIGVNFMPLLGGFYKDNYPGGPNQPTCANFIETMKANPKIYRSGSMVTIGNEIGFDDGRTPAEYALAFKKWYDCIKGYNPKIKIGTGATPWTPVIAVQNITGKEYFKQVIAQLGSSYIPDFVVHHAYSYRSGTAANDADGTIWIVNDIRKDMNTYGLRNKDLIIKEFSPSTTSDFAKTISYMDTVVNYFATTTNATYGNPDDGNRLVQKWAWFLSSESPTTLNNNPSWWFTILFDPNTNNLTQAGVKYKSLIDKYVPAGTPCTIQGYKMAYGPGTNPNPIESANINISADTVNMNCSTNPCVFLNIPGNKLYTVTLNVPAGVRSFSTACFSSVDCHDRYNYTRITSNIRKIVCPSGGYVDLWWGAESGMDIDKNDVINMSDVLLWLNKFLNEGFTNREFDFNKDGLYDLRDIIYLLKNIFV